MKKFSSQPMNVWIHQVAKGIKSALLTLNESDHIDKLLQNIL